jgi:hypothetical protein
LTTAQEGLVRTIIAATIFTLVFTSYCPPVAAQNNPVPFLNNPTVPAAAVPGGPAFTLQVNGAGFVNGATILWNGSARATTFVSGTQLTAIILASDIATASLVSVTVSNPSPGGGVSNPLVSNPVLFSVTTPATSLAFTRSESEFDPGGNSWVIQPTGLVAGSKPADGTPILAVADGKCPFLASCSADIGTIAEVGDLGFFPHDLVDSPQTIVTGDFNGDGVLDIVTVGQLIPSLNPNSNPNPNPNLDLYAVVSLGVSTGGGFLTGNEFSLVAGVSASPAPVVGDFNQDGNLDMVTGGELIGAISSVYFIPGNGDGTFIPGNGDGTLGTAIPSSTESSPEGGLVAGDFNGDGILDLAITYPQLNWVSILLGNGDGTFKTPVHYDTGASPGAVVAGDFNGDGKLDLAVLDGSGTTVSILLGNGDGTFGSNVEYPAGIAASSLTLGDFNGDGILDIALSDTQCANSVCPPNGSVNILLGNGDGTFPSQFSFPAGGEPMFIVTTGLVTASPTPVGRAGVAVANLLDNTVSIFSPQESQSGTGNPVPVISSISPTNAVVGSGSFTLTVNGSNFISSSTISFGGQTEPTTFVSASLLTTAILGSAIASAGPVWVLVSTPAPDGGVAEASFAVVLPPPTISSIVPSIVAAGAPGFTLTINGTNFVNGSTVNFNGTRTATFTNPTQITIPVSPSDVANQGIINVSVTDPLGIGNSGGGTSTSIPLTVVPTSSQPTVGDLSPASTTAGGQSFTLTISGTGFETKSLVTFGALTVNSAYQSPTELQATIPASAIVLGGTPLVTVANPGTPPSTVVTFTVNNPMPQESLLLPSSAVPGGAALTLKVTGSNFNVSSSVLINGAALPTTYVSSTLLDATVPANDLAQGGTLSVSVKNPTPGGGTTPALPFIVGDYILTASTSSKTVNPGVPAVFSLTVAPTNGTYPNPITLAATVPAADTTASFAPSATVTPGTTSQTVMLTIATTPPGAASAAYFPRSDRTSLFLLSLFGMAFALAGLVVPTSVRRGRRVAPQLLCVVLLAAVAGLVACGGSVAGTSSSTQQPAAPGTPPGTYTITVTATSGTVSHSTSVTLTVM